MKSPESYIELATAVHEGQKDKRGRDYINHPIEVSQAVKHLGPSYQAVAIFTILLKTQIPISGITMSWSRESRGLVLRLLTL